MALAVYRLQVEGSREGGPGTGVPGGGPGRGVPGGGSWEEVLGNVRLHTEGKRIVSFSRLDGSKTCHWLAMNKRVGPDSLPITSGGRSREGFREGGVPGGGVPGGGSAGKEGFRLASAGRSLSEFFLSRNMAQAQSVDNGQKT